MWTVPGAAGFIVGSTLTPVLARRFAARHVVAGGLAVGAVGALVLAQVDGTSGLPTIVIGTTVIAVGLAAVGTLGTDLIVGSAPQERAGSASAISETGTELGGALGVAILGSIGTAVYRSEIADAVPHDVAPGAAESARDTLGGAVAAADQLPASLLDAANHAFAHGLRLAAVITAALMVAGAVAMAVLLRERRSAPAALVAVEVPC